MSRTFDSEREGYRHLEPGTGDVEREPTGEDNLDLGAINPLINWPDLAQRNVVDSMNYVLNQKFKKYGGLSPVSMQSIKVDNRELKRSEYRFVARFELPELDEERMVLLEKLVDETYPGGVRTRNHENGRPMEAEKYPPLIAARGPESRTGGWYMGSDHSPTSNLHRGLLVFKDFGEVNNENFFDKSASSSKYIVEVRESDMYQTDLVQFVTQVSSILGRGTKISKGELLYEVYYDLIRLGLQKVDREDIYGLDTQIETINRKLIFPLVSPDLTRGAWGVPESILLVGVPGTGKTEIVKMLLQQNTGAFILPISAVDLARELKAKKEDQKIFPRIAEVARMTGKKIILHVDDIEKVVTEDDPGHSTLLNIMNGVWDYGFYMVASTNKPEEIDSALIQPGRFTEILHCPLQSEKARRAILEIHARKTSRRYGYPLFSSDSERSAILSAVARYTDSFTPRYLQEIVKDATSHLNWRIAQQTGRTIGLTEKDLEGNTFTFEDWRMALSHVLKSYDSRAVKDRDEEIRKFVEKSRRSLGFHPQDGLSVTEFLATVQRYLNDIEAQS